MFPYFYVSVFCIVQVICSNVFLRFYEKGEVKNYEHIESEWPLFYIYMIIDGVFKGASDQTSEYEELLKTRMMIDHNGGRQFFSVFLIYIFTVETCRSYHTKVLLCS